MYKLFLIFFISLFAFSCTKLDGAQGNWHSADQPNLNGLNPFFEENKFLSEVVYVFDQNFSQTIVTLSGVEFSIGDNIFENQWGNSVIGNITVKILEAPTKGKAMLFNLPKMGGETFENLNLLESIYAFRVVAFQAGEQLRLKPGKSFSVKVPSSSGMNSSLQLFVKQTSNEKDAWLKSSISVLNPQATTITCSCFETDWMNIGWEELKQGAQTDVELIAPYGFTDTNLVVYVAFDGKYKAAQFLHLNGDGYFTTSPNFSLSVGEKVHFIALSFKAGIPQYSIKSATVHDFHLDVIPELKAISSNELIQMLENLP